MTQPRPRTPPAPVDLTDISNEALLDVRMCDLPVSISGSRLEDRTRELAAELEARGITFQPHFWLSDDWFTPDGVGGVALPFYLAHPRLARLEESQMLEVEGGTPEWCMKILRHEAAHAIDNAYALRRRRKRQRIFGPSTIEYPEYYTPRPYSKSFVLHLDSWYAQSHPDEDFAETFAVWLAPGIDWRSRYAGWPALRKLEYVDELMRDVARREPVNRSRRRVDPLSSITRTLRSHYKRKRRHYGLDHPAFYDRDLHRVFTAAASAATHMKAAQFISRIRRELRRRVNEWTGAYQYTIDQVIEDIIRRCQELDLRVARGEEQTKIDLIIMLTVQVMNYLHSGRHRVAL